jgi:hypothetical protein
MKRGKIIPYSYLHLSRKYLGNKVILTPKVPEEPYEDKNGCLIEDPITPRISFATSIEKALYALSNTGSSIFRIGDKIYVYGCNELNGHVEPYELFFKCPSSPNNKYGVDFEFDKYIEYRFKYSGPCHNIEYQELLRNCVPDAKITEEIWATEPTEVYYVGVLKLVMR